MRKYGITILLVLFCLLGLRPLIMADTPTTPSWNLIFSEILLGTAVSGSEEFIEIFNPGSEPIDLSTWKIEYLSASAVTWDKPTRTIPLSGSISPNSYVLVASTVYEPDLTAIKYNSTLSQTGGHLRLINSVDGALIIEDLLAWGTAKLGLGDAVLSPDPGFGINRIKNQDELFEPKLNNIEDFVLSDVLTPLEDNLLPEPEVLPTPEELGEETQPTIDELGTQESKQAPVVYYPIEISELLPNPAEPLSDANDEFVELYNPYNFRVNLSDYRLLAGLNGSYKHIFNTEDFIEAGQYLIIKSKDTNLTLSNTAGKVILLAPDSTVLSQTNQYANAPEGQAWILHEGVWQWTTTITAGTSNQYSAPQPVVKSATVKKTTSKKATKAKAVTAKSKVNGSSNTNKSTEQLSYIEEVSGPVNPLVLAGTASLVVLYACYEYRKDFTNKIHQLRSYRANRRANRLNSTVQTSH